MDPISDEFPHLSTFNYASNDPISNIDLWGLQGVKYYVNQLKERVANIGNKIFGTNISTFGKPKSSPIRHGKFSIAAEGNLKLGMGAGIGVSANGIKGKLNADIGSVRLLEASIGTDGRELKTASKESYTFERDLGAKVGVTDNLTLGAGLEQKQERVNGGDIVSDEIKYNVGIKAGDTNIGISGGNDQQKGSDIRRYSISLGFMGQLFFGGEARIKFELKTSTDKSKLDDK